PDLARRGRGAAGSEQRREKSIAERAAAPRVVDGGDEAGAQHQVEEAALHIAERAGIQSAEILQVIAEAEQRRAGERAGGEAGSCGEFFDHAVLTSCAGVTIPRASPR